LQFDAPVVTLGPGDHVLELFHGPTLAFKDFGARFMARLMAWLIEHAAIKWKPVNRKKHAIIIG